MKKGVMFELEGDYAHFRKIYTTTSSLTYGIPPKTALSGLISAILGLDRDSYYEKFSNERFQVAIDLKKPLKKDKVNKNQLKIKKRSSGVVGYNKDWPSELERIQVPFEVVKKPKYQIYFSHSNEKLLKEVRNNLKEGKSIYTPYLGISEFIAQFRYEGEFETRKKKKKEEKIDSVVPEPFLDKIIPEEEKKYEREKVPAEMGLIEKGKERKTTSYKSIVFETQGTPITVENPQYHEIGDKSVLFF